MRKRAKAGGVGREGRKKERILRSRRKCRGKPCPSPVGRDGKGQQTQCDQGGWQPKAGSEYRMGTLCRLVHFKETLFSSPWFAGFLFCWPSRPLSCSASSVPMSPHCILWPSSKGAPPSSPSGRRGQQRSHRCTQGGGRKWGSARRWKDEVNEGCFQEKKMQANIHKLS